MEQSGSSSSGAAFERQTVWGMIDAEHIVFPVRSRELNAFTLGFATSADLVRPFVTGNAFEPVVRPDGTTEVVLALHEYASGDWGPLNAVDLCVPARPVGTTGSDGLFLIEAPIDEPFGNEASYWAMGIPHRLGGVDVTRSSRDIELTVTEDGQSSLTVRLRRPTPPSPWVSLARRLYTYVDRVPHVVPLDIGFPTEPLPPADVHVELGGGPLADTLRRLAFAEQPASYTWGEGMSAAFHLPSPLTLPG